MGVNLAEFAASNRPPTQSELDQLREILAPGESKLAQLEKEIKAKRDEKEKLLKKLKPARSAASWVRRLPTEIMGAIFLRARVPADGYATFHVCDAPLVLLRVCKLWRDIALNTPELWSSINIVIPITLIPLQALPSPEDLRRQELFLVEVDKWVARSANSPLALRVPSGSSDVLRSVLLKLIAHSRRWEFLDLSLSEMSETSREFLDDLHLPSLKRFQVTDYAGRTPYPLPNSPRSLFDYRTPFDSPALHELIIRSDMDSPLCFTQLPVRWENLTVLTITALYTRLVPFGWAPDPLPSMAIGLLPIFAKCANLIRLSLSLPMASPPEGEFTTENSTFVTLSVLEALSLEGCCKQMEAFLTSVDTAAIRELRYYPGYNLSPHLTSGFTNLLHKYGDQVEVLAFDLPTLPESEFLSCLRSSPSLKQLSVGPDRFENRFGSPPFYSFSNPNGRFVFADSHITALTPKQGEGCLCPRLEVFRCAVKAVVNPEVVMHFLEAKIDTSLRELSGAGPFRELSLIHLPFEYPIPPYRSYVGDKDDPLKDVRKAGVLLDLERPNYHNPSSYRGPCAGRPTQYDTNFQY